MDLEKQKRYAGLENQGATCYLNAVLQTLFMTEEFRNAVESSQKTNYLVHELAQLFASLKAGEANVNTKKITNVLKIGNVYEQQDAAKWFLEILNGSELTKTFQGIMVYTTTCKNRVKEHTSMEQTDNFLFMPIALGSSRHTNVKDCFDSLFNPVYMCGEDRLYCTSCKDMMDMETNRTLQRFPPVLVLHLKRFELDYNAMYYRKNSSKVEISSQLLVKGQNGEDREYELYAVIRHEGSLKSGHYYADIKSFENQNWYQFNDSNVHKILHLEKHCSKAYLLFYKSAIAEDISGQDSCKAENHNVPSGQDQDAKPNEAEPLLSEDQNAERDTKTPKVDFVKPCETKEPGKDSKKPKPCRKEDNQNKGEPSSLAEQQPIVSSAPGQESKDSGSETLKPSEDNRQIPESEEKTKQEAGVAQKNNQKEGEISCEADNPQSNGNNYPKEENPGPTSSNPETALILQCDDSTQNLPAEAKTLESKEIKPEESSGSKCDDQNSKSPQESRV